MLVINARNVNDAYHSGMHLVAREGERQETRYGPAYKVPRPVTTSYRNPMERVLFSESRDANPFFHLFEALWMLAGRNDVAFVSQFASRMASFSDDGQTFNAAYGYRWRTHFEQDQIVEAIKMLKKDPNTRRCIIGMWDPSYDIVQNTKDMPCNLAVKLSIVKDALQMTVFNRSNDIIWGCYGANMVHMSFLQEYVAGHLGVGVGTYYQVSDDYHSYCAIFEDKMSGVPDVCVDPYAKGEVIPYPVGVIQDGKFDDDLIALFKGKETAFSSPFFKNVVEPMLDTFYTYKRTKENRSDRITAPDWARACNEWIGRRKK